MNNDSYVIRKERCPECARLGNDRSGDNLAIYSDGHTYCYRCGHHSGRKTISQPIERNTSTITLPSDVTSELPYEAKRWLDQYELARLDIQQHNILWSEYWRRLIFPYFDETGLLAWQGRLFGDATNVQAKNSKGQLFLEKWYSKGKIHEIIHPIKVHSGEAVLVEDIVSAIKVSRHKGAIPIFGNTISPKHFLRIKHVAERVWIWLDPDMKQQSIKLCNTANLLGLKATVVFAEKDPKELSDDRISDCLRINQTT